MHVLEGTATLGSGQPIMNYHELKALLELPILTHSNSQDTKMTCNFKIYL